MSEMPGKSQNPGPPIGDPPKTDKPIKADRRMRDPFTDQATRPAGEGQGANSPEHDNHDEIDEETMPVEEGFSPVP